MRKNHYQQPGLRGRGIRSYVINSGLCCFGYNEVLGRERKLLRPPQLACIITHLELQMSYAIHFSSGPKFLFSFCLQSFLFREPDGLTYRALSVQTTVYLSLYLSSFFLFCFRKCKFHPFLAQCNVNDILANEMQLFVSASSVVE